MAEDTRPTVGAGERDQLAAFYAVNASGAFRHAFDALVMAEHGFPGEPPAEWASALGHLRLAVTDMHRCLDAEGVL